MKISTLGELRKFLEQNSHLPNDLQIIGRANDYDYPTPIEIEEGSYDQEASEFQGDTPCLIFNCQP